MEIFYKTARGCGRTAMMNEMLKEGNNMMTPKKDYKEGDRFIIEVGEKFHGDEGNVLYRLKGFNAAVWDDSGLDKLKKIDENSKGIRINLNDFVQVRLSKRGQEILSEEISFYNDFLEKYGFTKLRWPECDEDGYISIQIWKLMDIFGKYMSMGEETPIFHNEMFYEVQ